MALTLAPHDAFLLLPAPKMPTKAALTAAVKGFELGPVEIETGDELILRAGEVELLATLLPPMQDGTAEEGADHSLSGLDGSWTPPNHRAQLAVAQGGKKPSLDNLVVFTRLVAALSTASKAVGVFWSSAQATHHPDFVSDIAQSELPLPVWIGLSFAHGEKRTELLSLGMDQLGLPEVLLNAKQVGGAELEFFYELLATVVRLGRKLKDGERVGRGEKESIPVRYVASPLGGKKKVVEVKMK